MNEPKSITVCKADDNSTGGRIEITGLIPPFQGGHDWHKDAVNFYSQQGKSIADMLVGTLPGGTVDALLASLLEYKASVFRVGYSSIADTGEKSEEKRVPGRTKSY